MKFFAAKILIFLSAVCSMTALGMNRCQCRNRDGIFEIKLCKLDCYIQHKVCCEVEKNIDFDGFTKTLELIDELSKEAPKIHPERPRPNHEYEYKPEAHVGKGGDPRPNLIPSEHGYEYKPEPHVGKGGGSGVGEKVGYAAGGLCSLAVVLSIIQRYAKKYCGCGRGCGCGD